MPIVNVEDIGKIDFPDSMSREQIDAAIRNEILPAFRQRVAAATTPASPPQPAAGTLLQPNPFSKGTAFADASYKIGDRYRYRVVDLLTRIESREIGRAVTAITDTEVIFNNGNQITDLLGNTVKNNRGQTFTGRQIFVAEYRLGRKWTTTYRGTRRDLVPDVWTITLKVVARESITVPAGTFDAFKVEGHGYITDRGNQFQITYWIAPEKVRSFIAYEQMQRNKRGRLRISDRRELVSFRQGA